MKVDRKRTVDVGGKGVTPAPDGARRLTVHYVPGVDLSRPQPEDQAEPDADVDLSRPQSTPFVDRKRTSDQGRPKPRRRRLPWWGHVTIAVLVFGGIAGSWIAWNAIVGVLAVIASMLAEDLITRRYVGRPAAVAMVTAVVLATGAAAVTLDAIIPITVGQLAVGAGVLWLAIGLAWWRWRP